MLDLRTEAGRALADRIGRCRPSGNALRLYCSGDIEAPKNGSWSNGLKVTRNHSNTDFLPCRKRQLYAISLPRQSRGGGLNGIIGSSSRSWAWGTTRAEVGGASITMRVSASQLTGFSSPNGRRFPPQHLPVPKTARNLPFPAVPDPVTPPIRPERHTSNSIATLRRKLTVALARRMIRCPCCARPTRDKTRFMTQ